MSIVNKLKEEYDELHKGLLETPEDRHFDFLWAGRMDRALQAAEEHLPEDSHELRKIREHLHEVKKLMTKGLEHK